MIGVIYCPGMVLAYLRQLSLNTDRETYLVGTSNGSKAGVSVAHKELRAKGNLAERGKVTRLHGHRVTERNGLVRHRRTTRATEDSLDWSRNSSARDYEIGDGERWGRTDVARGGLGVVLLDVAGDGHVRLEREDVGRVGGARRVRAVGAVARDLVGVLRGDLRRRQRAKPLWARANGTRPRVGSSTYGDLGSAAETGSGKGHVGGGREMSDQVGGEAWSWLRSRPRSCSRRVRASRRSGSACTRRWTRAARRRRLSRPGIATSTRRASTATRSDVDRLSRRGSRSTPTSGSFSRPRSRARSTAPRGRASPSTKAWHVCLRSACAGFVKFSDLARRRPRLPSQDLFLLHDATSGAVRRLEAWRVLEEKQQQGKLLALGVSNFVRLPYRCSPARDATLY